MKDKTTSGKYIWMWGMFSSCSRNDISMVYNPHMRVALSDRATRTHSYFMF